MKIEFRLVNKNGQSEVVWEKNRLIFVMAKPLTIQSGEIVKVTTATIFTIPEDFILEISSDLSAVEKMVVLFPNLLTLSGQRETPLELMLLNSGRNPAQLMPKQPFAVAYGKSTEILESHPLEMKDQVSLISDKTKPQKKNSGIEFELRK